MTEDDWLNQGAGALPRLSWSCRTPGPLDCLRLALETGEILAAHSAGDLATFDRAGGEIDRQHLDGEIRALAWSDTGRGGVALVDDDRLCWFNRNLQPEEWIEFPESTLAVAIDPHGYYAAISLYDGSTLIYDATRKKVGGYSTAIPLTQLQFLSERPAIIGASEQGFLCCHAFDGKLIWKQALSFSVGGMAATAAGENIFLACFMHGVHCYDGDGKQLGSYQLGGTTSQVATSYRPGRLAAVTQENELVLLDVGGQIEFQGPLPDRPCAVACDPMARGVVVGMSGGAIWRLDWDAAAS